MWKPAIQAITNSDEDWIARNRKDFSQFFLEENEEPAGKFNERALRYHRREKLFKMFLGKDYNGLALPLERGSRWIENAAVLSSDWGWLLAIGVGGGYFADYLIERVARKFFSPREALVAGSGKPDGTAFERPDGKWEITGSWSYCSGSEQASMFTAVTERGGKFLAFIVVPEEVEIKKDWDAPGLKCTCSHSILVENKIVPTKHFFDLTVQPRTSEYPLATFPFILFARICFVPVVVGITRSFWSEVEDLLDLKKKTWERYQPERYQFIQNRMTEHSSHITKTKSDFYGRIELEWRKHLKGQELEEEKISDMGLSLAEYCYESVSEIFPKLGMDVLKKSHPIMLLWHDLQTAYQHMAFHSYNKRVTN